MINDAIMYNICIYITLNHAFLMCVYVYFLLQLSFNLYRRKVSQNETIFI